MVDYWLRQVVPALVPQLTHILIIHKYTCGWQLYCSHIAGIYISCKLYNHNYITGRDMIGYMDSRTMANSYRAGSCVAGSYMAGSYNAGISTWLAALRLNVFITVWTS